MSCSSFFPNFYENPFFSFFPPLSFLFLPHSSHTIVMISSIFLDISLLFSCCCFAFLFSFSSLSNPAISSPILQFSSVFFLHILPHSVVSISIQLYSFIIFAWFKFINKFIMITMLFLFLCKFPISASSFFFLLLFFLSFLLPPSSLFLHIPVWRFP